MHLTIDQALAIMRRLEIPFTSSAQHHRGVLMLDGASVLVVHCSRRRGDLPGMIPHKFRKNLRLTVEEFESLRDGEMSRADYCRILRLRLQEETR